MYDSKKRVLQSTILSITDFKENCEYFFTVFLYFFKKCKKMLLFFYKMYDIIYAYVEKIVQYGRIRQCGKE